MRQWGNEAMDVAPGALGHRELKFVDIQAHLRGGHSNAGADIVVYVHHGAH
jgi:hypothetical protein